MSEDSQEQFRFRERDRIGHPSAEDDELLLDCFVDTGTVDALAALEDRRNLLVGRTGTGKTALLRYLARKEHGAIELDPDSLAFHHVANSNAIPYLRERKVSLLPFFKRLWKHILICEIVRRRYRSEETLMERLMRFLKPEMRKQYADGKFLADYFKQFDQRFWITTETQGLKVTKRLESEIATEMGADFEAGPVSVNVGATGKRVRSQQEEIDQRARLQRIVNSDLIKDLNLAFSTLSSLLPDEQKPCYVLIDRLDQGWVEDGALPELTRALLDTSFEFRSVPNVKIIIALRRDLLERVYRATREWGGFQQEKYDAQTIDLTWSHERLTEIIDARVGVLVRRRYSKDGPPFAELLPNNVLEGKTKVPGAKYFLDRTLSRPRDAIMFFNECIKQSAGSPKLNIAQLQAAERTYSAARFNALCDEWRSLYPSLDVVCRRVLTKRTQSFRLSDISEEDLDALSQELSEPARTHDVFVREARAKPGDYTPFRQIIASVLFEAGIVGLKPKGAHGAEFVHSSGRLVDRSLIEPDCKLHVHRAFWRELQIRLQEQP
jgi:hypothetical protein